MTTQTSNNDTVDTNNTANKIFAIVQMGLKYARIETSLSAYQLQQLQQGQEKADWTPKIDTEIQTKTNSLNDQRHEVSLIMLLSGKTQQGQSIFQIKLEQSGVFEVKGFAKEEEDLLLRGYALSQLYPYATARVNELLIHSGFPPINMNPIDFVGLYQQQQAKNGAQTERTDKAVALEATPVLQ